MDLNCKQFNYDDWDCGFLPISGGSNCSTATDLSDYLIYRHTVYFEDSITNSGQEDWFIIEVGFNSIVTAWVANMNAKVEVTSDCSKPLHHYNGGPTNAAKSWVSPGQTLRVRVTHKNGKTGNYILQVYVDPLI